MEITNFCYTVLKKKLSVPKQAKYFFPINMDQIIFAPLYQKNSDYYHWGGGKSGLVPRQKVFLSTVLKISDRDRLVQKVLDFDHFLRNPGPVSRSKLTFCDHCIYSFVTHNGKCNRHVTTVITIELN